MAVPRIQHTNDRLRNAGPLVPAPQDVYGDGPTPTSGVLLYRQGDMMPLNEARARGFAAEAPPSDEPEPRNASARGRTVRIADREKS